MTKDSLLWQIALCRQTLNDRYTSKASKVGIEARLSELLVQLNSFSES